MPSKVVTADTTAKVIAAEVRTHRQYPTSITFNNHDGVTDHTFTLQDIFTPSPSNGNSYQTSPPLSPVTVNRGIWTVDQGSVVTLEKDDLEGIKCIGAMELLAEAIDAACFITVGYRSD